MRPTQQGLRHLASAVRVTQRQQAGGRPIDSLPLETQGQNEVQRRWDELSPELGMSRGSPIQRLMGERGARLTSKPCTKPPVPVPGHRVTRAGPRYVRV